MKITVVFKDNSYLECDNVKSVKIGMTEYVNGDIKNLKFNANQPLYIIGDKSNYIAPDNVKYWEIS